MDTDIPLDSALHSPLVSGHVEETNEVGHGYIHVVVIVMPERLNYREGRNLYRRITVNACIWSCRAECCSGHK